MMLAIPHVGHNFMPITSEQIIIRSSRVDQYVFALALGTPDYILLRASQV
jgi:hypothetical protein